MNYRKLYLDRLRTSQNASVFGVVLHGIFAGLLLAGGVGTVPPVALGIGCAVICFLNLLRGMQATRDLRVHDA